MDKINKPESDNETDWFANLTEDEHMLLIESPGLRLTSFLGSEAEGQPIYEAFIKGVKEAGDDEKSRFIRALASRFDEFMDLMNKIRGLIESDDPKNHLEAVRSAETFKFKLQTDAIVVYFGIVNLNSKLISFLKPSTVVPTLQEAAVGLIASLLTNTHGIIQNLIDQGLIEALIGILESQDIETVSEKNSKLVVQIVRALGDIALDKIEYRDRIISQGILGLLNKLIDFYRTGNEEAKTLFPTFILVLDMFVQEDTNVLPVEAMEHIFASTTKLFTYGVEQLIDDPDFFQRLSADSCIVIYKLMIMDKPKTLALVQNVPQFLINLIACMDWEINMGRNHVLISEVLPLLGGILSGPDELTQLVLDAGILEFIIRFLCCEDKHTQGVVDALFVIQNIGAGNYEQIQVLIDAKFLPMLIHLAKTANHFEVRQVAVEALGNMMAYGSFQQMAETSSQYESALEPICNLLQDAMDNEKGKEVDAQCIGVLLDGIRNMLYVNKMEEGKSEDDVLDLIYSFNGNEHIEQLQSHEDFQVYTKAYALLRDYFQGSDSEPDQPEPCVNLQENNE